MNLEKTLQDIESEDPAIGIGTAAATAGILAASLVIKIANKSKLKDLKRKSEKAKKELTKLIKKDEKAYRAYMKAYKSKNGKKIKKAMKHAIETPVMIAEQSYRVIELAEIALEKGKKSMVLEAYGAAMIGQAAVESATEIAELNLRELKDKEYDKEMRPRKYGLNLKAKRKAEEISMKTMPYIYNHK